MKLNKKHNVRGLNWKKNQMIKKLKDWKKNMLLGESIIRCETWNSSRFFLIINSSNLRLESWILLGLIILLF